MRLIRIVKLYKNAVHARENRENSKNSKDSDLKENENYSLNVSVHTSNTHMVNNNGSNSPASIFYLYRKKIN